MPKFGDPFDKKNSGIDKSDTKGMKEYLDGLGIQTKKQDIWVQLIQKKKYTISDIKSFTFHWVEFESRYPEFKDLVRFVEDRKPKKYIEEKNNSRGSRESFAKFTKSLGLKSHKKNPLGQKKESFRRINEIFSMDVKSHKL